MPPRPQPRKWALITGVTPGTLAESLATLLLKRGINIITTSTSTKDDITYLHPSPGSDHGFLITLQMNVTSRQSIAKAVHQVENLTDGKLDWLINFEHCGDFVPVLDLDVGMGEEMFDVNVWGVVRVLQGFWRLLREGGGGVVVNFGGDGGDGRRAYGGVWASSRAAVGSLSKVMEVELRPFGVGVVCLDLPVVRMEEGGLGGGGGIGEESVYWPVKDEVEAAMERLMVGEDGEDRFDVAERIVGVLLDEQTLDCRPVLEWWQLMLIAFLAWILPRWVLEGLNARATGLDKLGQSLSISTTHESKKES